MRTICSLVKPRSKSSCSPRSPCNIVSRCIVGLSCGRRVRLVHYSNSFCMEEAFSIFPTLTFRLPSVFRISCLKASTKDRGTNGPALPFYGQARPSLTADLQRTMSKELVQSFRSSQIVLTERASGNVISWSIGEAHRSGSLACQSIVDLE